MNTKVADTAIASSVQRIASAGTILAASQIAGMILQVFMFSLIQHRLSHADNGTLFWIQQTSALAFLLFTEMGINSVVTRLYVAYYTEPHVQERVITTFLIVRFGLWLLTSLGLCAFAIITEPTIIEYVALYLIYSGIAARGALLRMVFELRRRASNRITLPALASLLDLILTCSALMLMRDQLSLATVIIAFALGSVPGFVIMLLSDKQWHSISIVYFDVRIMHMIFRDTAPIFASICMMQLQDKCDTIILNTYFGREALGVFAAIMRVILPCISLLMIIANVVAPPVTQLYATEPQQAHKLAISGLRWTLVASSGCAVFIGVFACDILRMTAGSAYSSYSGILAIGIWSLPPSIVVAYLLAVLTALGLQRQALPMMLILGIGSVAMNAILIPYLGMYGAVLARIIAPSIASVAGLWVLQSSAQGSSALLRLLFRSTICFAFLLTIQYALSVQSISAFLDVAAMRFVLWGSITSIGFAVSTITTGMLTRSDILRARALLSMSTSSNSLT